MTAVRVLSLQSGSNGNCIYVEACGRSVLLDAGISGLQAERRLGSRSIDIRRVDALIVSHDHADHVRCAGIYQRKFGLPIYLTQATLRAARRTHDLGELTDVRHFAPGATLRFGKFVVHTIPTPHDAVEGVAFVVEAGGLRVGVLTDLGHVFPGLEALVESLDAVVLESNYDPRMLARGPYPEWLQDRIRGPGGHLSNQEAAALLRRNGGRLRWACLGHLSEENNDPAVALRTHRAEVRDDLPLHVAGRYEPTNVMEV